MIDLQGCSIGIEDTHNGLFTEQRRAGTDTKIYRLFLGKLKLDTTVLRHASFRYIQAGHYLDTGSNLLGKYQRGFGYFLQYTIRTEADTVHLLVRLKMDIGSPLLDSIQ